MIVIKKSHYIAEGIARVCYHHPDNDSLCIKIGKPETTEKDLYKEIDYFEKIKRKDVSKFDYHFYALYYGTIATNLGEGFVYDLIIDEPTQEISKTLLFYLQMDACPFSDEVLLEALERLKHQMITHKVFVGDLRARNICCKRLNDGAIELIVVDGLGHRDFFPVADWFHHFASKKVERRFEKAQLHSLDAQRDLIKRIREQYNTIP